MERLQAEETPFKGEAAELQRLLAELGPFKEKAELLESKTTELMTLLESRGKELNSLIKECYSAWGHRDKVCVGKNCNILEVTV